MMSGPQTMPPLIRYSVIDGSLQGFQVYLRCWTSTGAGEGGAIFRPFVEEPAVFQDEAGTFGSAEQIPSKAAPSGIVAGKPGRRHLFPCPVCHPDPLVAETDAAG